MWANEPEMAEKWEEEEKSENYIRVTEALRFCAIAAELKAYMCCY